MSARAYTAEAEAELARLRALPENEKAVAAFQDAYIKAAGRNQVDWFIAGLRAAVAAVAKEA